MTPTYRVPNGVDTNPYVMSPGIAGIDDLHSFARGPIGIKYEPEKNPGPIPVPGPSYDSREEPDADAGEMWKRRHASKVQAEKFVTVDTAGEQAPEEMNPRAIDPRTNPIPNYRLTQRVNMLGAYRYVRDLTPYGARRGDNDGTHGSYAVPVIGYTLDSAQTQRGRRMRRQTARTIPSPVEQQITTIDENVANYSVLAGGSSLTRWW